MEIVYEGPLEGVEIAATGQIAERGELIDVDMALAKQLVEQADWTDPNAPEELQDPDETDPFSEPPTTTDEEE